MIDDRRTEPPFRLNQRRTVKRYLLVSAASLTLLVVGYYSGRPFIAKWRYDRDIRNAERYEKEGDGRSAMLTLEQLTRLHPGDAAIRRRLAAFYERMGQIESIVVWQEAVALDPEDQRSRLGLARAAIRFGDPRIARAALEQVPAPGPEPAEYFRLQAGLALLERNPAEQEKSLAELARLAPDDLRVRLNLAMIRLADPHGAKAPAARAALLELARQDPVRMRAVAELLGDLARRWPRPTAERDAALRALAVTLAPPRGPLLALPSQLDHVDRLVAYAMQQPRPAAEDVISLANWMSLNGQTETVLQWIDTLPEDLRSNPLLRSAEGEFAARLKDWPRLRRLLLAGVWGPVPTEAVEQAFRAQASDTLGRSGGIRPGWAAALDAGKASPAGLRMLLRLAELWGWPAEHRLVLLTIARTMPRELWAWRQLIASALGRGDSEQLWQVYTEWRLAMPGDPVVQVESAIMGHLLGRRRVATAVETAEYLRQQPLNSGATVAHALALWREKRVPDALAVLETLPSSSYNEPRYALAGGVILAEAGRAAASEALLRGTDGEALLPEERALVTAARERNQVARP
ncbi:hypothetical protein Verru16b_00817 [Lacunisphaera limnophila]|uniref:Tetratricopeptide repeat protein n=1 Tax=Lacunisphaera limnophila TaxID=1838286 RepID=A0A1D8AS90_9BACT|nr:tetratricopeptide repeat protein [Lacunisphaera limnophila]AOS43761.1 hypothetical protein Verru16b_00817 [Lacunisphaera limnophila]